MEKPIPQVYLLLAYVGESIASKEPSQCVLAIQTTLYPCVRSDELQRPEALESKLIVKGIDNKRHHISELKQSINRGTRAAFETLSREGYNKHTMKVVYNLPRVVLNQHGFSSDLAFALAFITSFFRQQHYPDIAATGIVKDKGEIQGVKHIGDKLLSAVIELPDNAWIFLPRDNQADLSQEIIDRCESRSIKLHYVDHLDQVFNILGVKVRHYYQYNPFLGLNSFELKHAALFFGRNKEVKQASQQLNDRWEANTPSLLISGASGSGKSSFAQAGLLHEAIHGKLAAGTLAHNTRVIYSIFRPRQLTWETENTGARLWQALAKHWSQTLSVSFDETALSISTAPCILQQAMQSYAVENSLTGLRYIWIIDQLEELFTLDWNSQEQEIFIKLITVLPTKGIWIITTLRNDLFPGGELGRLLHKHFQSHGRYDLPLQDNAALRSIICEPAKLAGLRLEEKEGIRLEDRILQDINYQTDALPLLQLTLSQLYQQRHHDGNQLTFSAYEKMGGIEGAISSWAQKTYENLPDKQALYFSALLRHLVSVQENYQGESNVTARSISFSDLPESMHSLVENLATNRLLIREKDNLRITHESVFSNWDHTIEQLKYENLDLIFLQYLRKRTDKYFNAKSKDKTLFLSRSELKKSIDLKRKWKYSFSSKVKKYIKACKKNHRRKNLISLSLAITLMTLIVAYLYAWEIETPVYYKNINRTQIIPTVDENSHLTSKQHLENNRHYKVIRKGRYGKIKKISIVNRYDQCPVDADLLLTTWSSEYSQKDCWCDVKICHIEFSDNFGKDDTGVEHGYNSAGEEIFEITYSPADGEWDKEGEYTGFSNFHPKTDATLVKFKTNKNSENIISMSFWRRERGEQIKTTNFYGVHQQNFEYVDNEKKVVERFYTPKLKKDNDNHFLCSIESDYSENKRKDGITQIFKKYDSFGNEREVSYWSEKGDPTANKNGYQKITKEYYPNGNPKKIEYFTLEGSSFFVEYRYASVSTGGYSVNEFYFKWEGDESKIRKVFRKKDNHGNNYHNIESIFNDQGRLAKVTYYDLSPNHEIIHALVSKDRGAGENYHFKKIVYSPKSIKTSYFGENNQKALIGGYYHLEVDNYDDVGNLIETSYYGMNNEKANHRFGYHTLQYERKRNTGEAVAYTLLNQNGELIDKEVINYSAYEGYSRLEKKYDDRGNIESEIGYNHQSKKFFFLYKTYDMLGNETSVSYYDEAVSIDSSSAREESSRIPNLWEKRKIPDTEVWLTCKRYDENGNKIEQRHYGITGDLVMNKDRDNGGFSIRHQLYDPFTRELLCTVSLDEENKLITSPTSQKCTTDGQDSIHSIITK